MTRQLFLRLMLVALAASALMAIVSIYADTRIAWRIMGSTILAAVILLWFLRLFARLLGCGFHGRRPCSRG